VIALGRLGWPLRRIEQETGVRRDTAGAHLKAAGLGVRPSGGWGRRPPAKPANENRVTTGSDAAKPANAGEVTTGFGAELSASEPQNSPTRSVHQLMPRILGRIGYRGVFISNTLILGDLTDGVRNDRSPNTGLDHRVAGAGRGLRHSRKAASG